MAEATAAELLPKQSSTAWERANLDAHIQAWPIDPEEIRRQSDPMRCDAEMLPFLAFDRGITLWSDAWPEITKRRYIRDAWIYKRLEGTPLGVEAYLNLAGGRVIEEHLPPGRAFAIDDDGLTRAQLLALMPQLRLYHRHPPVFPARGTAFADVSFADACFAVPDKADILGRYPVLYDPATGVETPLQASPLALVEQTAAQVSFVEPATGAGAAWADVSFADACFAGDPIRPPPIVLDLADPNLVTVRDTSPFPRKAAVADVSFADDCFADPDRTGASTYDRLYIWDGSRIPQGPSAAQAAAFADVSYTDIPPYTELLRIVVPGTPALVRPGEAFADACFADAGAFAFDAADHRNHDFALLAIATARRAGDRILVDLAPSFAGTRDATLPAMEEL